MNRTQFSNILESPELLNEQTMDALREILVEYPFFQAGRMLYVKNLHLLEHIRYNSELKTAAAHIPDRAQLFDLIHAQIQHPADDVVVTAQPTTEVVCEKEQKDVANEPSLSADSGPVHDQQIKKEPASDYFDVSDVYEDASGKVHQFSDAKAEVDVPAKAEYDEHIVLPSADLLEYDQAYASGYQLPTDDARVSIEESRTFSEWLNLLKHQSVDLSNAKQPIKESKPVRKKTTQLIDNFLEKGVQAKPRRKPKREPSSQPHEDFSIPSLQENADLMTETLANIYINQKHFLKAIDIFEQLRLKYPEKNTYFAHRIKELEEQINNQ